jgi:hypothetical protein
MRINCGLLVALLSMSAGGLEAQVPASAKAAPIFDGKTFAGWEGNLKIFRIDEGAIVAGTLKEKIARNEFLCTTRPYSDFELRLKVKLLGGDGANAGIQFRTARIPNHHEVSGYQADMGTGWWGALYDESRRKKVLLGPDQAKMKEIVKAGDWNDYLVRAEGDHIRLSINGVQTVDYKEMDPAIERSGLICVQIHGGPPSEAWYKDIAITDLAR